MSNVQLLAGDSVLFAPDMPANVNLVMQQAVAASADPAQAESLLWEANKLDPEQLAVYVALYKFYFYKNRLLEANQVVELALSQSARLGGFDNDWRCLNEESTDWKRRDGPQRYYLYSLKALSFIRLRQGNHIEGKAVLQKLREIDPEDQVGASVLEDLASAITNDD